MDIKMARKIAPKKKKRIFILDGDPDLSKLMSKILESDGFKVELFDAIGPFQKALSEVYPDAILLDLTIHDEPGLDFLRKRSKIPQLKKIPLTVISSKNNRGILPEVLTYGVYEYLLKPINVPLVLNTVRGMCNTNRDISVALDSLLKLDAKILVDISNISETHFNVSSYAKFNENKLYHLKSIDLKKIGIPIVSFYCERGSTLSKISGKFESIFQLRGSGEASLTQIRNEKPPFKIGTKIIAQLDDDEEILKMIEYLVVNKVGATYHGFKTASEFLNFIKNEPCDLCIVDLDISEKTGAGFLVVKALRKHLPEGFPILIISGRATSIDIASGIEVGADDYLTKPISKDLFVAKIQQYLERKTLLEKKENHDARKDGKMVATMTLPLLPHAIDDRFLYFKSESFFLKGSTLEINGDIIKKILSKDSVEFEVHDCWVELETGMYLLKLLPSKIDDMYFGRLNKFICENSND